MLLIVIFKVLYLLSFYFLGFLFAKENKVFGVVLAISYAICDLVFLFNGINATEYLFLNIILKLIFTVIIYLLMEKNGSINKVSNSKSSHSSFTKEKYFLVFIMGSFFLTSFMFYNALFIHDWKIYKGYQENIIAELQSEKDPMCVVYGLVCSKSISPILNEKYNQIQSSNIVVEKTDNVGAKYFVLADGKDQWERITWHFFYLAAMSHFFWIFLWWYFTKQHRHLKKS